MIVSEVVNVVLTRLQAASDPAVKEKVLRLTSGANCIGVTVPNIREIAKGIKKDFALTFADACDVFDAVCSGKCREEILLCTFILGTFPKKQIEIDWERIEKWLPYLDNWETCDQLSCNLAVILIHRNEKDFDRLLKYAESPNLWIRRFAAATAANANHAGHSFPEQTRAVCDELKNEKEPMVKKAIVWALKEIGE